MFKIVGINVTKFKYLLHSNMEITVELPCKPFESASNFICNVIFKDVMKKNDTS